VTRISELRHALAMAVWHRNRDRGFRSIGWPWAPEARDQRERWLRRALEIRRSLRARP
jgi:hypothetical protein